MELEMPKFIEKKYYYYDDSGMMRLKPDAPKWAEKEYEEYTKDMQPFRIENGQIVL